MSLTFTIENHNDDDGGALLDADSTPTIVIRRTDTDAVVVPATYPTPTTANMVRDSEGIYSYTLDGSDASHPAPVAGITYRATWVMITDGETITDSFDQVAPSGTGSTLSLSGRYHDSVDIEDIFGVDNVRKWSQLDNSVTTADSSRVQRAITWADEEVDTFFRGGPYAVPLVLASGNATVTNWAATLAGVWLYQNRGQQDSEADEAGHFAMLKNSIRKSMREHKGGMKRLDATRAYADMPTGPSIIL